MARKENMKKRKTIKNRLTNDANYQQQLWEKIVRYKGSIRNDANYQQILEKIANFGLTKNKK